MIPNNRDAEILSVIQSVTLRKLLDALAALSNRQPAPYACFVYPGLRAVFRRTRGLGRILGFVDRPKQGRLITVSE
jgi:hypothetical protein